MERVKRLVHAEKVYRKGYTGRGVRIAVLDTGIAPCPQLGGNPLVFRDFVKNRERPYDDNGHGTHIAGILCGQGQREGWSGMAPGAELIVLKVLDEKGNGATATAIRALRWLLSHKDRYRVRLLNFSVGYLPGGSQKEKQQLLDAVDALWDSGVTVVTAAGNNGPRRQSVTIPGISRKVITVGASDDGGTALGNLGRGYSGRGPTGCCIVKPEILAPGTNIHSLGEGSLVVKSGTSMAAPVVCGALALALEREPALSPLALKLRLHDSVVPVGRTGQTTSWGLLHVDRLLELEK